MNDLIQMAEYQALNLRVIGSIPIQVNDFWNEWLSEPRPDETTDWPKAEGDPYEKDNC